MKQRNMWPMVAQSILAASLLCGMALVPTTTHSASSNGLLDDRRISIVTPADVTSKRQALIQYIWGTAGFPSSKLPATVRKAISSPVSQLGNLKRVDELQINMRSAEGRLVQVVAHHFIPSARQQRRLVILHHGHACTFNDDWSPADIGYGMQRTINHLLFEGYSVLAVFMPRLTPYECLSSGDVHNQLFTDGGYRPASGSPLQYFLEPTAVSLNYIKTKSATDGFPTYTEFDMAGLSGGGWTTTVYAAIDPTITYSFPVAGTMPLYLRAGGSVGDMEQTIEAFYRIAGYPDLYVLGSFESGRKQVQILNRRDGCCFGERSDLYNPPVAGMPWDAAIRAYEASVRNTLFNLGSTGWFRVEIDDAANSHQISHNAIVNTMLAELNDGRRYVGAAGASDAFVRGLNGHLWHNGPNGWADTGLALVGVPAVLRNAVHSFDVFYRDPFNRLMHAYDTGAGWQSERIWDDRVITDPAAVSWGSNRFDVVALDKDYLPHHWWWTGSSVGHEVSGTCKGLGMPALVTARPNRLDLFLKGWDRSIYHLQSNGLAPWSARTIGGVSLDSPAAVASGTTLRLYVRGQSSLLFEASQVDGGSWQWSSISAVTGSDGTRISGSPGAAIQGNGVRVFSRTATGNLASFTLSGGSWRFTNHGGGITGSPTAVPGGALVRGRSGGLWFFDGGAWIARGGLFD